MDYLPLFAELKQRPVLVIGGGEIAERKIKFLLRAQAPVKNWRPACDCTAKPGTVKPLRSQGCWQASALPCTESIQARAAGISSASVSRPTALPGWLKSGK